MLSSFHVACKNNGELDQNINRYFSPDSFDLRLSSSFAIANILKNSEVSLGTSLFLCLGYKSKSISKNSSFLCKINTLFLFF